MQKIYEQYPQLYHYTNEAGVFGILRSQSLWATNYQSLNDEREIKLFLEDVLPKILLPKVQNLFFKIMTESDWHAEYFFRNEQTLEELALSEFNRYLDILFRNFEDGIFVTSFTGLTEDQNINDHGLLSQWRSYGEDGGYSIVFDSDKLWRMCVKERRNNAIMSIGMGDVVYSDDETQIERELNEDILKIEKSILYFLNKISRGENYSPGKLAFNELVGAMCRYKHFGFKEEREVRIYSILTPPSISDNLSPKQIHQTSTGKKYIELYKDIEDKLPIVKIIVGPHKNKFERALLCYAIRQEKKRKDSQFHSPRRNRKS